jgi:hypothetical protein
MPVVSTLKMPVRVAVSGHSRARLDVRVTPLADFGVQARLDVTVDAAASEAARPRADREQLLSPWPVTIGGVPLPASRRLPGATLEESLEAGSVFSFAVPRRGSEPDEFVEPLGHPLNWLGVPGGKRAVNVDVEYLTPTGRKAVRVLTDGILDVSQGDTDQRGFVALSAAARYDRQQVTLQFPPGHNQQRGTVVRRIAEAAGWPSARVAISGGERMTKALVLAQAAAAESMILVLEPELRVPMVDRGGRLIALDYAATSERRLDWVFTAEDLLSGVGSFGDSENADSPTRLTLTSQAQVTRDECGQRVEYQVIDSYAVREIRGARYTQGVGTGTVSPVTWKGLPAELRHVERRVIVREFDCETLAAEETVAWGWYSPEMARYEQDATGAVGDYYFGYIYDDDPGSPLYYWPAERWVPVSWDRVQHVYDARGFLTTSVSRAGRWQINPAPAQHRNTSGQTWEAEDFEVAPMLADGTVIEPAIAGPEARPVAEGWDGPQLVYDERPEIEGAVAPSVLHRIKVDFPYHALRIVWDHSNSSWSAVAEINTASNTVTDGFLVAEEAVRQAWDLYESGTGLYRYSDGRVSAQSGYEFQVRGTERTSYAASGESNHAEYFARFDEQGRQVEGRSESGIAGYLTAATRRTDITPDPSIYDDPEEAAAALLARRDETQAIEAIVTSPALELVKERWDAGPVVVEYAETAEELERVGRHRLIWEAAPEVRFALPLNVMVRPGQRVALNCPAIGWIHDNILVTACLHQEPGSGSPGYTQVTGRAIMEVA